jgi:hypothetical protein
MDNRLLYYTPAEIEFRRHRAQRSKARRRTPRRAFWHRRHETEETT